MYLFLQLHADGIGLFKENSVTPQIILSMKDVKPICEKYQFLK